MLRVCTEDTFYRYWNDKEAPKAALMLAVNAREVKIQSHIVKLIQRIVYTGLKKAMGYGTRYSGPRPAIILR